MPFIQLAAPRTTGWTSIAGLLYLADMIRRRQGHDPLEPTVAPRWYVVRTMHGTVVESRELPRGADLKRAFLLAMLEWLDAGWNLGEFSSASAAFFCDRCPGGRNPERRMISIDPTDPNDVPMYGGAHLSGCPNCD